MEGLGLTWNPLTTQIESHDCQAELYADVARAGRIAHNLATDAWTYISTMCIRDRGGDDALTLGDDVGDRALNALGVCERGQGGGERKGVDAEGHEEGLNRADDLGICLLYTSRCV